MRLLDFIRMSQSWSTRITNLLGPLSLALAACTLPGISFGKTVSRPNIVIILADDMSTDSVAAFNPTLQIPTPNLDRLVSQGMTFTDAHTACSVCTPTRYGLLTGRYPWRTRLKSSVLWSYAPPLMDPQRLNLASMLKQRGYHTACIGKWHLGWNWQTNDGQPIAERDSGSRVDFSKPVSGGPTDVGFDYYFGDDVPNFSPYAWIENNRLTAMPTIEKPDDVFGNPGPMVPGWKLEDVLPELSRRAVGYVREQAACDEPFFLYLPLTSPHAPISVAKRFRGKSGTTLYGDFVQETDWVVGQVMQAIEDSGEADNTIVIFTTDNGTSLGFPRKEWQAELRKKKHFDTTGFELPGQQKWKPQYGDFEHTLRGGKFALYEGGHRVPFVVRWTDRVEAGTQNASLVSLNDVMATVAELVEFKLPTGAAEDSFSFVHALDGDQIERPSPVVATDFGGRFSVRKGASKIIFGKQGVELYDLSIDLKETNNIAKKRPDRVKEMTKDLREIVENGRSTSGPFVQNDGGKWWSKLPWPKASPNVLFIISDDLTATALSCYGNQQCKTPNIDALAARGLRFDRAYCQYPACGPARAALMSGLYPQSIGATSNTTTKDIEHEFGDRPSMTELFRHHGYYTARVSKIFHMRVPGDITAGSDGFDHPQSWSERFNVQAPEWKSEGIHELPTDQKVKDSDRSLHFKLGFGGALYTVKTAGDGAEQADAQAAAKAGSLLKNMGDKPFFLAVGLVRPHVPLVAPQSYFNAYPSGSMKLARHSKSDWDDLPAASIVKINSRSLGIEDDPVRQQKVLAAYYAAVSFMDAQVGRILNALDDSGLRDNTIVVFTSDHGYHLGEHGFWEKMSLHEESARIPLIIVVPGQSQGSVTKSICEQIDIYPTLAELAGLKIPAHVCGVSLTRLLREPQATVRKEAYCVRGKSDHLLRTERYAYMRYGKGGEELYDMETDPKQYTNLADDSAFASLKSRLRQRLEAKLKSREMKR